MLNEQHYYLQQSPNTDPGEYGYLYDSISNNIEDIFRASRNIVEHHLGMNAYRIKKSRLSDIDINSVGFMLDRLSKNGVVSLKEEIPFEHKVIGNCFNVSKVACSILRHKKIPARIRYAYCMYFYPDMGHEQTIIEYWSSEKNAWLLGDVSMNKEVLNFKGINVDIDLCNVNKNLSRPIADVWMECRDGKGDFSYYGASLNGLMDFFGMGNVALKLTQDLACLNNLELIQWDYIGLPSRHEQSKQLNLEAFDKLAELLKNGTWSDLLYTSGKLPFCVIPRRILRKSQYTGISLTSFKDGKWKTN